MAAEKSPEWQCLRAGSEHAKGWSSVSLYVACSMKLGRGLLCRRYCNCCRPHRDRFVGPGFVSPTGDRRRHDRGTRLRLGCYCNPARALASLAVAWKANTEITAPRPATTTP